MDRQSEKITALYCRIGGPIGNCDTLAAQSQKDRLFHYAQEQDLKNPKFYCDWGFSGTNPNRPEYQHLLQDILDGQVSDLVVFDLSRLTRDYIVCWDLIGVVLPQRGIIFHSVKDGTAISETLNMFAQMKEDILRVFRSKRGQR